MNVGDCFSGNIRKRFEATVRVARKADPGPTYPTEDRIAHAEACVRKGLPPGLWNAFSPKNIGVYGGWNPLVVFFGLSPGTYTAEKPELTFGLPVAWERRRPGGRFWMPQEIHNLTFEASRRAFSRECSEWDEAFWREATASAFVVVNASQDATPIGESPAIQETAATEILEIFDAVRPRALVSLKPTAADWFDTHIRQNLKKPVRHIGMPVHPMALGKGIRRYNEAREGVIESLAAALRAREHALGTIKADKRSQPCDSPPQEPTAEPERAPSPPAPYGLDPYNIGRHKPKAIPPQARSLIGIRPAVYSISTDKANGRRHHSIAVRLKGGRIIEHGGNYEKVRHIKYVHEHSQRYGLPIDVQHSDIEGIG